jgi:hypothetical protein
MSYYLSKLFYLILIYLTIYIFLFIYAFIIKKYYKFKGGDSLIFFNKLQNNQIYYFKDFISDTPYILEW